MSCAPLRPLIRLSGLAVATAALALSACGDGLDRGDAPDEIGFAFSSSRQGEDPGVWRAVLRDMEAATGYEVRPGYPSDNTSLAEAMADGEADIGWFSGRAALEAVRSGDGEVFARVIDLRDVPPQEAPRPEDLIVYRAGLDPAVKEKLRQFFLTYGQGDTARAERQRRHLAALSIGGFRTADATHLLPVRELEAAEAAERAREGGDPEAIEDAERELDEIRRERIEVAGKAGEPLVPPEE